jgi:hypothetical protein
VRRAARPRARNARHRFPVDATLEDIVAEGERLLDLATGDGVAVRLLGGVAVRVQAPDLPAAFERLHKDLDLAAPKGGAAAADKLPSAGSARCSCPRPA